MVFLQPENSFISIELNSTWFIGFLISFINYFRIYLHLKNSSPEFIQMGIMTGS